MNAPQKRPFAASPVFIFVACIGLTFGYSSLLLTITLLLQDWIPFAVLASLCAYLFVTSMARLIKNPYRVYLIITSLSLVVGAAQIILIIIRWEFWMEKYRKTTYFNPSNDTESWIMISIFVIISALLSAQFYSLHTKNNRFRTSEKPRYE
ncbi:MAG: hypothetical protein ACI9TH_000728 [Kiritimatiellia bacterium]|jgi:hypothetical protein